MRRIGAMLSVFAVLLLLDAPAVRAAGGGNPPTGTYKVSGPTVNATILMDPHCQAFGPPPAGGGPAPCIQGGQATVWLNKGQTVASFEILSSFLVTAGCVDDLVSDPSGNIGIPLGNPNQRFLFTGGNGKNLTDWVPPFDLQSLFLPLGISTFPAASVWPAITQISSAKCLISPPPPPGTGASGWLRMDVTIQLLVPTTK
jgi:hypothetical protein